MIYAYMIGAACILVGLSMSQPLMILPGIAILFLSRSEDNDRKPESTWDRSYPITDDPNDTPDSTWRK